MSDPIEDLPDPLYRFLCWYEWQVLKRADVTVFVYESSYREAGKNGIDGVRLPNAVDFERFANPDEAVVEEARSVLAAGVDLEKPIAIYLESLIPWSHIPEIVEAEEMTPEWEFVFVADGILTNSVTSASSELENVHYPGEFEYRLMPGFLAHATAGFCFVDAEQPLKLKEYGAGIPAIVQYGVLEKWYDEDDLCSCMMNPELYRSSLIICGVTAKPSWNPVKISGGSRGTTAGRLLPPGTTNCSETSLLDSRATSHRFDHCY